MRRAELEALPSPKLFGLCASHFDDDRFWEEFVRRYNTGLTQTVLQAYKRFSDEDQFPPWTVSEILQEVYLKILKDNCSSLRSFRGDSEIEAEVYLMHIAISVTIDRLRRKQALKRFVEIESIEDSTLIKELETQHETVPSPYTDELAERELITTLRRSFRGKNRERNILIFMLHFREGLTPQEIANTNVWDLTPTSIAHILDRMRERIRDVLFIN